MKLETGMYRVTARGVFMTVLPADNYIVSDIQPPDQYLLVYPEACL